jgi:hypothetical protein
MRVYLDHLGLAQINDAIMKPIVLLSLFGIASLGLAGCAQYDDNAMAGAAVDMPAPTPVLDEPSVLTAPSPSPTPR